MLSLCVLLTSEALIQLFPRSLQLQASPQPQTEPYHLTQFDQEHEFIEFIKRSKHQVDCLILEDSANLSLTFKKLRERAVFLPVVVLSLQPDHAEVRESADELLISSVTPYHAAVLRLSGDRLSQLPNVIDEAIGKFLRLSPAASSQGLEVAPGDGSDLVVQSSLTRQQQRLSERLKERLGYLGVYYKRNPAYFLRHMSQNERQELLNQLKDEYRQIILNYFLDDPQLNEKLDNFVNLAFFADVPVAQIVEIHMNLMDEFAKQLRLEGRSDEVLLDYRLTLIDAIAHLCEMYRRSIPRES